VRKSDNKQNKRFLVETDRKEQDVKLTNRPSTCTLVFYLVVLSIGFVCLGCSSKKTGEKKAETSASSRKEVKQLKRKNNKLKKAAAKTVQGKERRVRVGSQLDKDKVSAIIAEFDSPISAERKIELIKSLSKVISADELSVISVVQKSLDDSNPEVGRAAITLLEDYETPEILPVVERALNSKDEQTRIAALTPLSGIDDPQVSNLIIQALSDTSEDVRTAALEAVDEQEDPINLSVMKKGISSPYKDVKSTVVSSLENRGDHIALEILIEGLKDTDATFREDINETLDFLIDKQFKTYKEARAWWLKNKNNYDENLFLIDDK
jgi:HEAT repeat protein